ncbi:PREDICTED: uncharacterized protein LOC109325900 [Lupinus angustifolius]|uniref:uncharacterized protein LOC109325900 n=1 Tax=Lupinus angustifolius TaxID=3871 RepID=UPI00092E33C4|nr:PREDICTED: uncharacterized protein LOC109325900 [Lupinus angustifolius]
MTTITSNLSTDPSSVYYMYPNENPGVVFVSSLLNGKNYHSWSRAMTMALGTKNKLEFVDGSMSNPLIHDQNFPILNRCNKLVASWLTQSIDPSIVQSVLWMDNAKETWDDLRDRYYQGDMFRIFELIGDIHSIREGNKSVSAFYNQIQGLWQQLDDYRPIAPWQCELKCTTIPVVKNYRENNYVICFLKGLNDQFSAVRSQIMLSDPLPPIKKVFSILVQQERHMQLEEPRLTINAFDSNVDSRIMRRGI